MTSELVTTFFYDSEQCQKSIVYIIKFGTYFVTVKKMRLIGLLTVYNNILNNNHFNCNMKAKRKFF